MGPRIRGGDAVRRRPFHPDVDMAAVEEIWAEWEREPETDASVDEILDRNYYETISSYDERARLPRRLQLRVSGPNVVAGEPEAAAVEQLLHAFQIELKGAAQQQGNAPTPSLRLAGVSGGSAVLHLAPAAAENHPDDDQMAVVTDQFDSLMATVTELHDLAEGAGDLRRFAEHVTLLKGLREMVTALDQHDLELDLRWRSATGARRESQLTSQARAYVRRQWEEEETRNMARLSGRLTALDLNKGTFTLTSLDPRKRTYQVHVEDEARLLGLGLDLGERYAVEAEEVLRTNRAGLEGQKMYRFVRVVEHEERLG